MTKLRGFTLVELLVVVSIIGILTTVVVVSLTTANTRAKDGAVQADLAGIRASAQLYYNDNSGYGAVAVNSTDDCTTGTTGTLFADAKVMKQVAAANLANGGGTTDDVFCNVSAGGAEYAVFARLPSIASPTTYFCVDSNGVAKRTTTAVPATLTACPTP